MRLLETALLATVALLLAIAPALADGAASAQAPTITPAEVQARRTSGTAPVLIDVRTAAEYETGHVPDAVNIPFDEIGARIGEVDAPNGVALYCLVGPRARKGEAALFEAGYTSVLHLDGGFSAWKASGLPVETGK